MQIEMKNLGSGVRKIDPSEEEASDVSSSSENSSDDERCGKKSASNSSGSGSGDSDSDGDGDSDRVGLIHRRRSSFDDFDGELGLGDDEDGDGDDIEDIEILEENYWDVPIWRQVSNRLPLLLALLLLQSASSFILKEFEGLVEKHFVITMYLTMLVGTGGNAGGQSAATALQGLANGQITRSQTVLLLIRELTISLAISLVIGFVGFWRVFLMTDKATVVDGIAVSLSLMFIVMTSIIVGAGLPMLMDYLMHALQKFAERWARMLDPANTTFPVFQVVMDILGILIVCGTCTVIYSIFSDASATECKCHCSHESGKIWDIKNCDAVGSLINYDKHYAAAHQND